MLLGYNTNGLATGDLIASIDSLRRIGYRAIAITLDHHALNPYDAEIEKQIERVAEALAQHRMRCVIETGARFLLDTHTKHEPTLVSADAAGRVRRIDFLRRAIDIAAKLNADCVSFWSGAVRDEVDDRQAFARLIAGLMDVVEYAAETRVALAFEPEPDMFIDTMGRFDELLNELSDRQIDKTQLRLTLDIGHLHCQGELPIGEKILAWRDHLANVHIEDMRAGVHEHLMFGEGEIDFRPVLAALAQIGYDGVVGVELSRHAHLGPQAARRAYNFLRPLLDEVRPADPGSE
jgi:L-ribulose-5-phosphate 3-epimerase